MRRIWITGLALAAMSLFLSANVHAQTKAGPIRLVVDASQAAQKILHTHLEIPVSPGPMTLYYPEWIPGEHMPDGPIIEVAGLKFSGAGKTIPWRRDLVEMFSIHLTIPAGVTSLIVDFDFLLSAPATGYSAGCFGHQFPGFAELESGFALPQRLQHSRYYVHAKFEASRRMEIRDGASRRQAERRHD